MRSFKLNGRLSRLAFLVAGGLVLAACQDAAVPKHMKPMPAKLTARMQKLEMSPSAPIYIRAYKESSEFEVWKKRRDGRYALLATYPICKWSGKLGPKIKEGDRQAPEGFYTVTPAQMNPNSSYYLSFNTGFPNAFDRAHGRTGTNLMVHGACSSAGCYSMTDEAAGEIYWLARDAFIGGQRSFEVNLYPFRMTAENMARHRNDPNYEFWTMLKEGSDHFMATGNVPRVGVCGKKYVFDVDTGGVKLDPSAPCPAYTVPPQITAAVKAKQAKDEVLFAAYVAREQGQQDSAAQMAIAEATQAAGAAAQANLDAAMAAPLAPPAPQPKPADLVAVAAMAPAAVAQPLAAEESAYPSAPATTAGIPDTAVLGEPAPDMPLPVPSPLRASLAPPVRMMAPQPPPEPQGFWSKMRKRLAIPGVNG